MRAVMVWGAALGALLAAGCDLGNDDSGPPAPPAPPVLPSPPPPPPSSPVIVAVQPSTVSSAGGSVITILGAGFAAGAAVTVGPDLAAGVTVQGSGLITVVVPRAASGATGAQTITVTNPGGGTAVAAQSLTYVATAIHASTDGVSAVDLDIDENGIVHAAWTAHLAGAVTAVRYARSINGGLTWSAPAVLASTTDPVGRPRVGAGGGSVLVLWNHTVGGSHRVTHVTSSDAGLTWSFAGTFVQTAGQVPSADVAVDPNGRATIVYRFQGTTGAGGTPVHLQAVSGPVGGPYAASVALTSGQFTSGVPAVAAGAANSLLVAYRVTPIGGGAPEVVTQRSADGGTSFASAVQASQAGAAGTTPGAPEVALSGGIAVVAWASAGTDSQGNAVTNIVARTSTLAGSSWNGGGTVSAGLPGAQRTGVVAAVSGNGRITVAWQELVAGQASRVGSSHSTDGGTSWIGVTDRSGTAGASLAPAVAGGTGQTFVHAWLDAPVAGAANAVFSY